MASKRDQSTVSKAEFKKYHGPTKARVVRYAKECVRDFEKQFEKGFGKLAIKRLRKSAKIGKRSTLEHCLRLAK